MSNLIDLSSRKVRIERRLLPQAKRKKGLRVMPGVHQLVVMLPSGDWAAMPSGSKLEVVVVDQSAIEELRRGVDIRDVKCRSRYGLFITDMPQNLYTCVTKEK